MASIFFQLIVTTSEVDATAKTISIFLSTSVPPHGHDHGHCFITAAVNDSLAGPCHPSYNVV